MFHVFQNGTYIYVKKLTFFVVEPLKTKIFSLKDSVKDLILNECESVEHFAPHVYLLWFPWSWFIHQGCVVYNVTIRNKTQLLQLCVCVCVCVCVCLRVCVDLLKMISVRKIGTLEDCMVILISSSHAVKKRSGF